MHAMRGTLNKLTTAALIRRLYVHSSVVVPPVANEDGTVLLSESERSNERSARPERSGIRSDLQAAMPEHR